LQKEKTMEKSREEGYKSPAKAILTGIGDLFRKKGAQVELKDTDRLDGKKVLLTGASSGLGFATAVELARRGAHLVMAVRSGIPDKGEEVKRKSGSDTVEMIRLDLAVLESLPEFVSELRERFGTFDVVICNAGVVTNQSRQLKSGLDEMFTVNYFAKFLLLNHCMESNFLNTEGGKVPRIIFVASESHRNASGFDWEGFGRYTPYGIRQSVAMYGYFKLLLVTMAQELSRRINPPEAHLVKTSVFSLCPGPVNSNIAREAPAVFKPLLRLIFWVFFRSPARACRPIVYMAASPELEGKTGHYLFLMQPKTTDPKAADPGNGGKLWEESENLMKKIQTDWATIEA